MIGLLLSLLGIGLVSALVEDDDDQNEIRTSNEPENVTGSADVDIIDTAGGDDTVFAGAGSDLVNAGSGDDRVFGQGDPDLVFGGEGDDFIRGGSDGDLLTGDAGEDTIFGDVGDDLIAGADIFDSAALFDALDGATRVPNISDFIDITLETGEADTLDGGLDNDSIIAGSNDEVITGTGADRVDIGDWIIPNEPAVITDFDPAEDVIFYSYTGATPPNVFFGEDADTGDLTVEVAISDQENAVVALLTGVDFFDVGPNNLFLVPLG
ncbi:MAG: hypothetical protein AAF601_02535 [Pseudomonadota bacterium]